LITVDVIGVNGDTVCISGEQEGLDGIWLAEGLEGFYDPKIETVTKAYGSRPGTRFISHRVTERRIVMKIRFTGLGEQGASWREVDARWRRMWAFDDYTTIRVTTDESVRSLKARLESLEVDLTHNPEYQEYSEAVMEVVADDPFWYGEPEQYTVHVSDRAEFEVPYANPGDVEIFPEWVLEGPGIWTIPDHDFNTGTTLNIPLPELKSGNTLLVRTDPGARQLADTQGTNIWGKMNGVRFQHPIKPHTGTHTFVVTRRGSRASRATLVLRRVFTRPWGWS